MQVLFEDGQHLFIPIQEMYSKLEISWNQIAENLIRP